VKTYYFLSLTGKCNRGCSYCIVKKFINNPEYPDRLEKDDLLKFFKDILPGDLVEITGGEPTLVPWLEELIEFFDSKDVLIVLRTNGFRLFKNIYKNLLIVFNPHDESEGYKNARKALLKETDITIGETFNIEMMDNTKVENNTVYPLFKPQGESSLTIHPFDNARIIFHTGTIYQCHGVTERHIGMVKRGYFRPEWTRYRPCDHCPFILVPWNFVQRLIPKPAR